MRQLILLVFAAILGGAMALGGAMWLQSDTLNFVNGNNDPAHKATFVDYRDVPAGVAAPEEGFTKAAERTLPSVVHIRATGRAMAGRNPFDMRELPDSFREFFGIPEDGGQGGEMPRREGAGSGVIISADGYIVTNNHVVQEADELEVALNDQRVYPATVIGTDPNTDIALIKIEATDLPTITFGNSDAIRVGQWVVAVGNPFNLASTVTAGIVSAKGRSINILEGQAPIEAFIQTDAVVNPGNSGGALVNIDGDLVGINTAISSPTGVFAGYAFAVPSNIVAKVVSDLKEFGVVQRGYLGAIIRGVDGRFAQEKNLSTTNGVYVDSLVADGAAANAGLKRGDIITQVDGVRTNTSPELLEQIGRHRPGDKVNLTVLRNGSEQNFSVTLKNRSGTTELVKKEEQSDVLASLGAEFANLSREERSRLGLNAGVKVLEINNGILRDRTDMREGFIITKVNRQAIRSVDDLNSALQAAKGDGVMVEGVYPGSKEVVYYAFGMS